MKKFYKWNLAMSLVIAGFVAQSQDIPIHWTQSIEECAQVAPNQLEYSVYLQFDGATPNIELLSYAFGINFNSAILNGGVGSCEQIKPRDQAFKSLPAPKLNVVVGTKFNGGTETGQVRITQSVNSYGQGARNINPEAPKPGTKLFLGRFRLSTSAASFSKNAIAGLSIQCPLKVGRANFSVIYDIGGVPPSKTATSFSTNPPQPAASCISTTACSALILNPE